MVWWAERGYWHGTRHGRGSGRLFSLFLALSWWIALPLAVPAQIIFTARPRTRYYMTPERDAVLAITSSARGWHVEDHASARPGTGRGRALRAAVLPELLAAADAQGIAVHATAATPSLAAHYKAEVPGLVDVGPGWPRGRRLRRDPVGTGADTQKNRAVRIQG